MKHKKKIGKFNLLEENICELDCKCGWNLHIGGEDIKDLESIKRYLEATEEEVVFKDNTHRLIGMTFEEWKESLFKDGKNI